MILARRMWKDVDSCGNFDSDRLILALVSAMAPRGRVRYTSGMGLGERKMAIKNGSVYRFHWWLARRVGESKTLIFVPTIETEQNEEVGGGFIATISDLEPGTVIAAGTTVQEATVAAIESFQDMVDDCLDKKRDLSELIGKHEIMAEVDQPIDKVMQALDTLEKRAERESRRRVEQRPSRDKWLIGNGGLEGASDGGEVSRNAQIPDSR